MTKKEIAAMKKKAMMHLERIRQSVDDSSHPFKKMTKEEVIEALRRTREQLWEEKLASGFRRQRIHLRTGT